MSATRLRQIALVARDLAAAADRLADKLGLGAPYRDPGVGEFGLDNAVFAVGASFLEIVSPVRDDTTAGRYLERRGGDGGYMALFQITDTAAARRRVADEGVRVVWQTDLDDITGTHLHPGDVPGAIVSLDEASPWPSWRWGGPEWTGGAPPHGPGGLRGVTVRVSDPSSAAARWAAVLGVAADEADVVRLDEGRQTLRFAPAADRADEGIAAVDLAVPAPVRAGREAVTVAGVRFTLTDEEKT